MEQMHIGQYLWTYWYLFWRLWPVKTSTAKTSYLSRLERSLRWQTARVWHNV